MKEYRGLLSVAGAFFIFSMSCAMALPIRSSFTYSHDSNVVLTACKAGGKNCTPVSGVQPKRCNPCSIEGSGPFNGSGKGEQPIGPDDPMPVGGIPNRTASPHQGTLSPSGNFHY